MNTHCARVIAVHDGDTLTLLVDLGFDTFHRGAFRLLGCNARELSQVGGAEARDNLASLLPVGTVVTIGTTKPDKFGGRYDASLSLPDGRDVVSVLIATGWAAAWNGVGVKPVPIWPRETG